MWEVWEVSGVWDIKRPRNKNLLHSFRRVTPVVGNSSVAKQNQELKSCPDNQ
ncbi:MAG: hypothetical protein F6K23_00465 [Okeania sp. SIO2C9]|uniref:hypothetical protein n=1 Tax=Okeania sp. SIO2C9 TaxID=2607791 RepID=UPI0013C2701D|nr:hypothetical protein [Okeania sp. SIO2C9]NEQ71685.1 hypothetical protein [Okeania sp. SIO2C9]